MKRAIDAGKACPRIMTAICHAIAALPMFTVFLALSAAGTGVCAAQLLSSRPVKIIVQTAAGSSIDVAARVLADNLSQKWGRQAIVLNQPGAGGAIAAKVLAVAPPDGETLLLAASSIFVALPELQKHQAAAIDAFVPVAFVGETPMAIAVGADNPAKTFAELLANIRATPGGFNCAVSTRGGLSHLSGESLRMAANIDLTFVHYPGTAQALTDVIAGRVPIVLDSLSAFVGPVANGQIRILAVASAKRLKGQPDVATVAETLPGFEATAWLALVAPPGTPAPVTARIAHDVDDVLADNAVDKRMLDIGTFVRRMPEPEFADFIKTQRAKWAPVVQKFGQAP